MADRQRQILLLFSHKVEMEPCVEAIRAKTYVPFKAELTGIGPRNARQRTAHFVEELGGNATILCLGSSGWLIPKTPPAAPVWAREVKSESRRCFRPTLGLPTEVIDRFGWSSARLITVSRPVLDDERAITLASEIGVEMVDMESRAVLQECTERHVECGVVRAITDLADSSGLASYRSQVSSAMTLLGQGVADLLKWLQVREETRLVNGHD